MKLILSLVLLVLAGCSSGPVLKEGCDPVANRDAEFACKGDLVFPDCDPVANQEDKYVCGKAESVQCSESPGFAGHYLCIEE